jgi:hypothetical protein
MLDVGPVTFALVSSIWNRISKQGPTMMIGGLFVNIQF